MLKSDNTAPTVTNTVLPVSWDLAPSTEQLEQLHYGLKTSGIRVFPYPFRSAFAITSDIDLSCTENFRKYTGQIVQQHGLDFGDSIWLQTNDSHGNSGLAFYSWNYGFWNRKTNLGSKEYDHHDLANEYHQGNVDHWHCLTVRGPRLVRLLPIAGDNRNIVRIELPPRKKRSGDAYYGVQQLQTAAIGLIHTRGDEPVIDKIIMRGKVLLSKREWIFVPEQADAKLLERHTGQQAGDHMISVFPLAGSSADDREIPRIEYVDNIEIYLKQGSADAVKEIIIYNMYADLLLDRVSQLQQKFNIWMNLMTIHGQWMIPQYYTHMRQNEKFAENVKKDFLIGIESLFGSGEIHGLKFSTNCDEPNSFVKIYPELLDNCGVSFWRPTGNGDLNRRISEADKTRYCSMLDLVIPSVRRDGEGIYLLTTTKARVRNLVGDRMHDVKTISLNFPERCGVILDDFREQQERVAVMYTHLGNLTPLRHPPNPYFDEGLFARLRKLSHGIDYQETDGPRLWFTRASVISDYAMLIRQIAEHVQRPDGNTVVVKRWADPYLKLELPRDKNQMYGLTFYVEDAGKAKVYLEGEEIVDLVRNPADETGRESVTVAACGIGRVVLGGLDPALTSQLVMPTVGKQGTHDYDAQTQSLRLHARGVKHWRNWLRGASQVYGLGIHKNDFRVDGAQHMKVVMKRGTAASRIGLLVRTATGGKFYFGDETLLPAVGDVTASYTRGFERVQTGEWTTVIIPFYGLKWHVPESTDVLQVALPANTHAGVDLLVSGDESASVEVQEIVFTRPRTVGAKGEKRVVIGGRVKGAEKGTEVRLKRIDGAEDYTTQVETDDLGGFVFSQMSPGGYEVQINGNSPVAVECWYDRYDIQLRQ